MVKRVVLWESADGLRHRSRGAAIAHEKRIALNREPKRPAREVYKTPEGKWSIPCRKCGTRHLMPYSDDFVWCPDCRRECAGAGHEPDDEDPTWCFRCGESGLTATACAGSQDDARRGIRDPTQP